MTEYLWIVFGESTLSGELISIHTSREIALKVAKFEEKYWEKISIKQYQKNSLLKEWEMIKVLK